MTSGSSAAALDSSPTTTTRGMRARSGSGGDPDRGLVRGVCATTPVQSEFSMLWPPCAAARSASVVTVHVGHSCDVAAAPLARDPISSAHHAPCNAPAGALEEEDDDRPAAAGAGAARSSLPHVVALLSGAALPAQQGEDLPQEEERSAQPRDDGTPLVAAAELQSGAGRLQSVGK